MALSYAGVKLPLASAKAAALIAAKIDPRECFEQQAWPGKGRTHWTWPGHVPLPPVRVGVLHWPRGASRWAVGYFLATDNQLGPIRDYVYAGNSYRAAPLVLSHQRRVGGALQMVGTVTATMWMLPPRPLFEIENGLHLLALVDSRYWWPWENTGATVVTENTTTWADLFTSVGTSLGVAITPDTIHADYLKPPEALTNYYERPAHLLDLLAYNVGHRVVVGLDGTVTTQGPGTALDASDDNLALAGGRLGAGGEFALAVGQVNDLPAVLPESVVLACPRKDDGAFTGAYHALTASLADLDVAELEGAVTKAGSVKTFRDLAAACFTAAVLQNGTELQNLANRVATDWYRFQAAALDVKFWGVVEWEPEGFNDSVEWTYRIDEISTRVQRPAWNDLAEELLHASATCGAAPSTPASLTVRDDDTTVVPTTTITFLNETGLYVEDNGGGEAIVGWSAEIITVEQTWNIDVTFNFPITINNTTVTFVNVDVTFDENTTVIFYGPVTFDTTVIFTEGLPLTCSNTNVVAVVNNVNEIVADNEAGLYFTEELAPNVALLTLDLSGIDITFSGEITFTETVTFAGQCYPITLTPRPFCCTGRVPGSVWMFGDHIYYSPREVEEGETQPQHIRRLLSVSSSTVMAGLICYYRFDETGDDVVEGTFKDSGGHGYHLQPGNGGDLTEDGKVGGGLDLDTTNLSAYAETTTPPNHIIGDGDFAMSGWFYLREDADAPVDVGFFVLGEAGELRVQAGGFQFKWYNSVGTPDTIEAAVPGGLERDTWYHLFAVVVFDLGGNHEVRIYLDGVLANSDTTIIHPEGVTIPIIYAGSNDPWSVTPEKAIVDELFAYECEFRESHVEDVYNGGNGKPFPPSDAPTPDELGITGDFPGIIVADAPGEPLRVTLPGTTYMAPEVGAAVNTYLQSYLGP
jgi:hypothetical protein